MRTIETEIFYRNLWLLQNFTREFKRLPLAREEFGGFRLGSWVCKFRSRYRRGTLPQWCIDELETVEGFTWEAKPKDTMLNLAKKYIPLHGMPSTTEIFEDHELGNWISSKISLYHSGKLSPRLIGELESIKNFTWQR